MSKFYHDTRFFDQIFKRQINSVVNKLDLDFRLSLILVNRPIKSCRVRCVDQDETVSTFNDGSVHEDLLLHNSKSDHDLDL